MSQPYGDLASYSDKDVCAAASSSLEPPLTGECGAYMWLVYNSSEANEAKRMQWVRRLNFHSTTNRNMVLRRRLIGVLPGLTRPSLTRGQRGQRPWSMRYPQSSINAMPYRYFGLAGHATLAGPDNSSSIMSPRDPAVTQAVAQAAGSDAPEEGAITASSSGPDPDSEIPAVETWHEAVDTILEATRAAFPQSPAFDAASPGVFQSYWRGVFARLHERVASDDSIPEHLTSPPSRAFWVNLFAQAPTAEPACPCCLPDVEPSVKLENAEGVTKGDLIAGLGGVLYGAGRPPRVYAEDPDGGLVPEAEEEKRPGVLVHGADWMSEGGGGDDEGRKYVYTGGWIGRPAMIWMYCSQWREFESRAATDAKDETEGKDGMGVTAKL